MFQQPKSFKLLGTRPSSGCFATENNPSDWENCREDFSQSFKLTDSGLYFSISPGQIENVSSFILRTENILNISDHSSFAATNYEEVMWINLSPFWRTDFVRCSLFTILLRCGRRYNIYDDKYESALFSEWQIRETKNAIHRFLFGYTKYVPPQPNQEYNHRQGWHWLFKNISEREVRLRLTSPDKKLNIFLAGNKSLWI